MSVSKASSAGIFTDLMGFAIPGISSILSLLSANNEYRQAQERIKRYTSELSKLITKPEEIVSQTKEVNRVFNTASTEVLNENAYLLSNVANSGVVNAILKAKIAANKASAILNKTKTIEDRNRQILLNIANAQASISNAPDTLVSLLEGGLQGYMIADTLEYRKKLLSRFK